MGKLTMTMGAIFFILCATCIQSLAEENVIYGCVDEKGKMVIIDSVSQCKDKKAVIYWNKVGPQGPAGDQGPIGFTGPQGPTGECDCPISQEQFDELVARIRFLESGKNRFD